MRGGGHAAGVPSFTSLTHLPLDGLGVLSTEVSEARRVNLHKWLSGTILNRRIRRGIRPSSLPTQASEARRRRGAERVPSRAHAVACLLERVRKVLHIHAIKARNPPDTQCEELVSAKSATHIRRRAR